MLYTTLSIPRCVTFKTIIANFHRAKKIYQHKTFQKRSKQHIWTLHFLPTLKTIKYSLIITSYEVIYGKNNQIDGSWLFGCTIAKA